MERFFLEKQPFIETSDRNEKVIALGYFDGVHLGHQKVIQKAVEVAKEKGLASAVMTFYPHPSVVLTPSAKREDCLTPLNMKAELIEKLGVDILYFVRFDTYLSQLSPQDFVDNYLIRLHAKHVVAGFDFTFGRMAKGNMNNIESYSRSMFSYSVVPKVEMYGKKVSTTYIREKISQGAVDEAARMLGRPYRTEGVVVHGDKRGRKLGFPTANVESQEAFLLPLKGVYVVRLIVGGKALNGVCSIGTRPTFYDGENAKTTVEVYVLDFDGNLYDQSVSIDWYQRLRGELKFSGAEALIGQMEQDKADAARYFETESAGRI
ncbi:bifunctional riboflavin kinase/FAD synthetase [Sporolactobacillus sp. THM7-4]|nr:bifunctional riboflavin kinase/FAD synthetase [Sporolactobacillus sp. THM7-4]